MELQTFNERCVNDKRDKQLIEDTIHYINVNSDIEKDAPLLARVSQQIIICRLDELWMNFISVCEFAEFKAVSDEAKCFVYKAFMNYYNYTGLSSKVIKYALKYEKLQLTPDKNYEVFSMAAFSLYETGFYEKAIEYILKSQKAFNCPQVDNIFKVISYNNLVYCYDAIGRMDKMLETYNKFKNLIDIESDVQLRERMQLIFKMCSFFVKIKMGEESKVTNKAVFDEYRKYIVNLSTKKQEDIMESEDVHLPFIDYAIGEKNYEDAVNICRILIKSPNVSGFKKNIYKRLIYIYQQLGEKVSKQEVFDTVLDYNIVLERYNDKYDKIMHDMVNEEFIVADMEAKYINMKRDYRIDSLTNCYNRKAFDNDIQKKKSGINNGCVVFIDLDHLKKINDNYGHECGDIYIRYFAYITNSIIGKNSKLYRYGGDEFVIITDITKNEAEILVQKLKNVFVTPCNINNIRVKLEFSYGIEEYGKNMDLMSAIKDADKYMYNNKKSKR